MNAMGGPRRMSKKTKEVRKAPKKAKKAAKKSQEGRRKGRYVERAAKVSVLNVGIAS
jgi:hypothetical protein